MLRKTCILLVATVMLTGAPLLAQMMGMMPPSMSGVWNPAIGSGATYEMVDKNGQKQSITMAIVGKEDSNGQPGYWMEVLVTDKNGQQSVIQELMLKDGAQVTISKMIIQAGGRGPMEMSGSTIMAMAGRSGGAAPTPPKADFREGAEHVGTESVTTPAGTFDADHWRGKDGSDVWISTKVAPWGIVKATTPSSSMTVTKVITDAKSHIVGTPVNMDGMMGRGRGL